MDNKKFNIVAIVLLVVMAAFTIFNSVKSNSAKDGRDGLSAYELAVLNGEFTGSEFEYLQSLHGKDGSNVTLQDVYEAYKKETNSNCTFSQFILSFYPDELLDADEAATLVQSSTASALRSTVDICYGFYMQKPIIYLYETKTTTGETVFKINESADYLDKYTAIGVSAGSGVIYQIEDNGTADKTDDYAYIITNYHVLYADNFTNNEEDYRVYYNQDTEEYFTATYDESMIKAAKENVYDLNIFMEPVIIGTRDIKCFDKEDLVEAPIETHFLKEYSIYLYGYQSSDCEIKASFVGGSADNDIAVLKVEYNKSKNNQRLFDGNYKEVDLGDSKNLDEGETVIAVGNPLLVDTSNVNQTSGVETYVSSLKQSYVDKLCLTSTSGEISSISEYCKFQSLLNPENAVDMRLMRVSAAINAGNSGGGLYDIYGRLVGIVNGKIADEAYDNVGFAIPINVAARLADKIIDECDGTNTRVKTILSTTTSFGLTVKNGVGSTYYDPNISGGSWVRKNNVVVNTSTVAGVNAGSVIAAISFNDSQTKYELSEYYDFNDIMLLAKKGETTKIVLHLLQSGGTTLPVEVAVTDAMFVEVV